MAIWKYDNQTTTGLSNKVGERGRFEIIQDGMVELPGRSTLTLNGTNVAHLSKAVIKHNMKPEIIDHVELFSKPPTVVIMGKKGYLTYDKESEIWAGFEGRTNLIYDGVNWIEEIRFYMIDSRYIRICKLTLRHAGTSPDNFIIGEFAYYYLLASITNSDNFGGIGGSATDETTYLHYDTNFYDSNNNLTGSKTGSLLTNSFIPYRRLDSYKYTRALHGLTE